MKRVLSLGLDIAQTPAIIALICITIVFVTYFGLEMAANWMAQIPVIILNQLSKKLSPAV